MSDKGQGAIADVAPHSKNGLWLDELQNTNLRQLRELLNGKGLSLFRLPVELEVAFRSYFRASSAHLLRKSVYGLIALYLLVVVPVAWLAVGDYKLTWLSTSVAPIGIVLMGVWLVSQMSHAERYVEAALAGGVFVCLVGTVYCALALDGYYFGLVAAFEAIYVIIVAFSVLKLRTRLALSGCLAAALLASTMATLQGIDVNGLNLLLFFLVPVLICSLNGCMLEHAARRDFVQMLCHQKEKASLMQEMEAIGKEASDIDAVLEFCLTRVCSHMDWVSGRATLAEQQCLGPVQISSVSAGVTAEVLQTIEKNWPENLPSDLGQDVARFGRPAWAKQSVDLGEGGGSTRLAFPVQIGTEVVAVLEFFSPRDEGMNASVLSLMEQVSQQLGRVFERVRQERALHRVAMEDRLTGLPNRAAFLSDINAALSRGDRHPEYQFCVLFIGIDRFKWINDSLGHLAGDQVLKEVSRRLCEHLRPTDVVARMSGDEFAILMDDIHFPEDAVTLVSRVREKFTAPVDIDGQSINITTSIGIAYSDYGYYAPEDVISDADTAMSLAKRTSRGGYQIFDESMREQVKYRLKLTEDLKLAIEADELELYYQPITCMQSGRVAGFESLVRWRHPDMGMIFPDEFIHLAEETRLIIPLTKWVIRTAARQLGLWQRQVDPELMMSVNLCASYFASASMPEEVLAVMREYSVHPGSLRLEITETEIIENEAACMRNIQRLSLDSIPVYIDDFGTGYSSLNYLANYRVSALKIDKSFLDKITEGDKEAIVVRTIASLGRSLDMKVIAEGVETPEQLDCLLEIGCDYIQGYLVAKPLPAAAALELIGQTVIDVAPVKSVAT